MCFLNRNKLRFNVFSLLKHDVARGLEVVMRDVLPFQGFLYSLRIGHPGKSVYRGWGKSSLPLNAKTPRNLESTWRKSQIFRGFNTQAWPKRNYSKCATLFNLLLPP